MVHKIGASNGADDMYFGRMGTSIFDDLDVIEWYVQGSSFTTSKHNVTMATIPPPPDENSYNDIVIDGNIGSDWSDGNFTLTLDETGTTDGLNGLYFALNSTGFSMALNVSKGAGDKSFAILIDSDNGQHGNTHMNTSNWARNLYYPDGFKADHLIGMDTQYDPVLQYWGCLDDETKYWQDPTWGNHVAASVDQGNGIFNHEIFVKWNSLYWNDTLSYGVFPENAKLKIVALMFDTAATNGKVLDFLPNNMNMANVTKLSNWIEILIDSDGDAIADLHGEIPAPTAVYWAGGESDSSVNGFLLAGEIINFSSILALGINDHPNATAMANLHYRYFNVTSNSWGNAMVMPMVHVFGSYDVNNNDMFYAQLGTSMYKNGDIIEWYMTSAFGNSPKHYTSIGPDTAVATHNDIVIDGDIGNDWTDGTYTFTGDADESGANILGLYTAINHTGLSIGLDTKKGTGEHAFMVFIDVDEGATGMSTANCSCAFAREINFPSGFRPNYMLAAWDPVDTVLNYWGTTDGDKWWIDAGVGAHFSSGADKGNEK